MALPGHEGNWLELEGQIAVVTGAASGMRRATALRFSADGATVVLIDVNEAGLSDVRGAIADQGGRSQAYTVDLLQRSEIKSAFAQIDADLGPVDILFNNAGGPARAGMRTFPNAGEEQWDEVIDLNLRSVADCTRQVIGTMKSRRQGRIISTTSYHAFGGGRGFTDYAAAKAGLHGFTRSLAIEMAPYNVTVNAVVPGVIRTGFATNWTEQREQQHRDSIPMNRIGRAEDIAHAVSFFASPRADYVTGTCLLVSGGKIVN
ncbi:MAG: SDR family NAD(P)-dependent oxidoreductase [Pseudomonadota bacterium]